MKKKVVILFISILFMLTVLVGLVACDDNVLKDGENDYSNGKGMRFEKELGSERLIEIINDGEIRNYTMKVVEEKENDKNTTAIYYVADGMFYWYYTYLSDNSVSFAGYSIDSSFAYSIEPYHNEWKIIKYSFGSENYNSFKQVLTFSGDRGLISYNLSNEDGAEIKDFKVNNDIITWTRKEERWSPYEQYYVELRITLYNVNSTEECEFPEECKNYKEIAVERTAD